MSVPPDDRNVDHDEVHRREQQDVEPVGPKKGLFTPINILMVAVVVIAGIWFLYTMLA